MRSGRPPPSCTSWVSPPTPCRSTTSRWPSPARFRRRAQLHRQSRGDGPPVSRRPDPALEDLKPDDLAASLTRLLETLRRRPEFQNRSRIRRKIARQGQVEGGRAVLDLMVIVHPRELDKAAVRSLLADAIASPAPSPVLGRRDRRPMNNWRPRSRRLARSTRTTCRSRSPRRCWRWLGRRQADRAGARPAQPVGREDTARTSSRGRESQRAPAASRPPARSRSGWSPARAGSRKTRSSSGKLADKLAARAVEAARRQTENKP